MPIILNSKSSTNTNKTLSPQFFSADFIFDSHTFDRYQHSLTINKQFLLFCRLIAFLGLISLIGFFIINFNLPQVYFFWQHQSWFLVIFYLSLLIDLFLIFEFISSLQNKNKINKIINSLPTSTNANLTLAQPENSNQISIIPAFSTPLIEICHLAYLDVKNTHSQITILDLFYQITASSYFSNLANRLNINQTDLQENLLRQLNLQNQSWTNSQTSFSTVSFSPELQNAFISAFIIAVENDFFELDIESVCTALYQHSPLIQEILFALEVSSDEFYGCLQWLKINRLLITQQQNYRHSAKFKATGDMNASYTASSTPLLNQFATDLTISAQREELPLCVGRTQELQTITAAFASGQQGIVLVGPPQVGKRTIVGGLAQLMVEEKVPPQIQDKRLLSLDLSKLLAGADALLVEKRLLYILREAISSGNIVFFIDNLEQLFSAHHLGGSSEGFNFTQMLADAVKNKKIYLIASCQEQTFAQQVETQSLGQVLLKIKVAEPALKETILILQTKALALEEKNKIRFSYDALAKATELADRYLTDKRLPQKAIEVIELAAVKAKNRCQQNNNQTCLCSPDDVMAVISDFTQIPLQKVSADETQKLLNLEKELHEHLIGQNEAVEAVSKALRRARTDLQQNQHQPLASFLFLGPTGVGKTELSKSIARVYFGDEHNMIRLDMTEYQLASDINKMIGDGTRLGYLTEAVRKKPYSLILFDEIEKAHPDVLNLFLQMLDEGRLTDGRGQTISFANTIIIATSNAGATYISQAVSQNEPITTIREKLLNELLFEYFRPEFINRFDDVIVFTPLSNEEIMAIVKLTLIKVKHNLAEKGINLEATAGAVSAVARESYDPQYGARPMRRFIKDKLESQIALMLLDGSLQRRDTVVLGDELNLKVIKAPSL